MYRTTSVMALGLFFGLAPVGGFAQTTTTDQTQTQQQLTQPETQQQTTQPTLPGAEDEPDVAIDEPDTADEPDVAIDEPDTADEPDVAMDEPEAEAEDVIAEQDDREILATSLMGASVNLADESIGTVSDLIIAEDHTIRGVVVGVGGFLGIGAKRVALPMERITVRTLEPGEVELAADITREELEEKEPFRTAAQIHADREAEQAQQMQQQQQPLAVD